MQGIHGSWDDCRRVGEESDVGNLRNAISGRSLIGAFSPRFSPDEHFFCLMNALPRHFGPNQVLSGILIRLTGALVRQPMPEGPERPNKGIHKFPTDQTSTEE